MKRVRAIEAMDQLAHQGYSVQLHAIPMPDHISPERDENGIVYRVSVHALHFDKVDLKHLCAQGDALGLEVTVGGLTNGTIDFTMEDTTPESVRGRRRHPR